jgi:hypothetical protein
MPEAKVKKRHRETCNPRGLRPEPNPTTSEHGKVQILDVAALEKNSLSE